MSDIAVADPSLSPVDEQPAALFPGKRGAAALRTASVLWIVLGWAGLAAMVYAGASYGVIVRKWAWDQTVSVRFQGDIRNGFNQGNRVLQTGRKIAAKANRPMAWGDFFAGFLQNFENVVRDSPNGRYSLDYTPARLLVMSLWVKHLSERDPPVTRWENDYATTAPLLHFNAACSAVAALAMVALVRHWRRARDGLRLRPDPGRPWREWPAVLAGLAVWLNPALIWNTHAWPQWDVWLVPFFLLAVLAASKQWWFTAGFVCAIGATLKGQVLMIVPIFVLWTIFSGKPLAAVRFLLGGACCASVMILPWMAHQTLGRWWLLGVLVSTLASVGVLGVRRKFDALGVVTAVLAGMVLFLVLLQSPTGRALHGVGVLTLLVTILPRYLPRREWGPLIAGVMAGAIFLCGYAFDGQWAWYEVGYAYPTRHYLAMSIGPITNLPAILSSRFQWQLASPIDLPLYGEVTIRTYLIVVYAVTLLICAIGAAVHSRRRSPRVMIAFMAPWVLMFAILPQMHERYLLWGAVVMCAGIGVSVGHALLAGVVIFLACINMAGSMLGRDPDLLPTFYQYVQAMRPGAGWLTLLLAAVYLYTSIEPERRITISRR